MDAYIHQAALWCSDCTDKLKADIPKPAHVDESDESSYDSDEWPKGPYSDGGGEADCPQHCDVCGVFLDNDLTDDGRAYVESAILDYLESDGCSGHGDVLAEWLEAYGDSIDWDGESIVRAMLEATHKRERAREQLRAQ